MNEIEREDRALAVSSFVRKGEYANVSQALETLGISFKKGKDFWVTNEAELEYLYYDFCKISREVLIDLHPDRGGDHDEFIEFNKVIARVKKAFHKRGIGKENTIFDEIKRQEKAKKYTPKTRDKTAKEFLKGVEGLEEKLAFEQDLNVTKGLSGDPNIIQLEHKQHQRNFTAETKAKFHAKDLQIVKLLLAGLTNGEIIRIAFVGNDRIEDVITRLKNKIPDCACGRPRKHQGMCAARDERSPARQNFLKNVLPKINKEKLKGVPKTKEHREKISKALAGRKPSEETIFKIVRNRLMKDNYKMSDDTKKKMSLASKGKPKEWAKIHFKKKCDELFQAIQELIATNQYPSNQLLMLKTNFSRSSIIRFKKGLKERNLWPLSSEILSKLQ